MTTYSIVRFRQDGPREVISTGLTLDEAQAHCQDESTHGDGWFDGYEAEDDDEEDELPDTCLAPDGHWYVVTYGRARWQIHARDCVTCEEDRSEPPRDIPDDFPTPPWGEQQAQINYLESRYDVAGEDAYYGNGDDW